MSYLINSSRTEDLIASVVTLFLLCFLAAVFIAAFFSSNQGTGTTGESPPHASFDFRSSNTNAFGRQPFMRQTKTTTQVVNKPAPTVHAMQHTNIATRQPDCTTTSSIPLHPQRATKKTTIILGGTRHVAHPHHISNPQHPDLHPVVKPVARVEDAAPCTALNKHPKSPSMQTQRPSVRQNACDQSKHVISAPLRTPEQHTTQKPPTAPPQPQFHSLSVQRDHNPSTLIQTARNNPQQHKPPMPKK